MERLVIGGFCTTPVIGHMETYILQKEKRKRSSQAKLIKIRQSTNKMTTGKN